MPIDYETLIAGYGLTIGAIYLVKAAVSPLMLEKNSKGKKYLSKSSLAWLLLPFPVDYVASSAMAKREKSDLENKLS